MDGQENQTMDDQKINPEFSLATQMVRLKLSYFKHIMQRPSFLEKVLMLEKGYKVGKNGKKENKTISSVVDGLSCSGNSCLKMPLAGQTAQHLV